MDSGCINWWNIFFGIYSWAKFRLSSSSLSNLYSNTLVHKKKRTIAGWHIQCSNEAD
jgi:hypothetical protein